MMSKVGVAVPIAEGGGRDPHVKSMNFNRLR